MRWPRKRLIATISRSAVWGIAVGLGLGFSALALQGRLPETFGTILGAAIGAGLAVAGSVYASRRDTVEEREQLCRFVIYVGCEVEKSLFRVSEGMGIVDKRAGNPAIQPGETIAAERMNAIRLHFDMALESLRVAERRLERIAPMVYRLSATQLGYWIELEQFLATTPELLNEHRCRLTVSTHAIPVETAAAVESTFDRLHSCVENFWTELT